MRKIGMTALRRGIGRVIEKIDGGEVFLITKNGEPCFLGLDAETYFDLPIYSFWGRGRDFSAFGFRKDMAALADEQGEVAHVHYNPSQSSYRYEAVFVPPWVAKVAAAEFDSPLREVLEGAQEPKRWRPGVEIWKCNRFRSHVHDGIREAEKGVLGIEKRGLLIAYVVSMGVAKFYLQFLKSEWQAREEYFPSSYEEWERLDSLLKGMRLKPPGLPGALAEGVFFEELTTTELRERYTEVCEDQKTVYVVLRYATPVCMVIPVEFYKILWRCVWFWWNSFGDLAGLAGKARWALKEYYR